MTSGRDEPLRNAAIATELERAVARRTYDELFALLCRFSGLPAPRSNEKLGWAVAHAIADHGSRADDLLGVLCAEGRGVGKGTVEFLPIVGAFGWAARFARGTPARAVLAALRELAEDPRHSVRGGVVTALVEMGHTGGEEVADALASWSDGFLSASVALEAVSARTWLDGLRSHEAAIARLDEAFSLAHDASRSDQRSQGYRTLLKTLPEAAARIVDRFPDAAVAWLESRASTEHVELREAMGELVTRVLAHGHGLGKLERFEELFAQSAPPRRDPKTYVGPTRKRGAKRR